MGSLAFESADGRIEVRVRIRVNRNPSPSPSPNPNPNSLTLTLNQTRCGSSATGPVRRARRCCGLCIRGDSKRSVDEAVPRTVQVLNHLIVEELLSRTRQGDIRDAPEILASASRLLRAADLSAEADEHKLLMGLRALLPEAVVEPLLDFDLSDLSDEPDKQKIDGILIKS